MQKTQPTSHVKGQGCHKENVYRLLYSYVSGGVSACAYYILLRSALGYDCVCELAARGRTVIRQWSYLNLVFVIFQCRWCESSLNYRIQTNSSCFWQCLFLRSEHVGKTYELLSKEKYVVTRLIKYEDKGTIKNNNRGVSLKLSTRALSCDEA